MGHQWTYLPSSIKKMNIFFPDDFQFYNLYIFDVIINLKNIMSVHVIPLKRTIVFSQARMLEQRLV